MLFYTLLYNTEYDVYNTLHLILSIHYQTVCQQIASEWANCGCVFFLPFSCIASNTVAEMSIKSVHKHKQLSLNISFVAMKTCDIHMTFS